MPQQLICLRTNWKESGVTIDMDGLCPRAVTVGLPIMTEDSSPCSQAPDFVLGDAAGTLM